MKKEKKTIPSRNSLYFVALDMDWFRTRYLTSTKTTKAI